MSSYLPPAAGETIGQRIKRLRLERGLSQRELAVPGVSYAYISRIEAGSRQPSVKALRRLAGKLGVSPEFLETGSQLDPGQELELRLADLELQVRLGDAEGAEERLQAVLADAQGAGDRSASLRARVALATLAQEAGDFGRMVELLEPPLEEEEFSPLERPDLYGYLGYAYAASGRPRLAVELYERCLEEVRRVDAPPALEARYATLLSYALGDIGELARAERVVREALERNRDSEDPYTRVRLHWSLARLAHAENRPVLALENARRAIALLETTEDTITLARAHLLAASIMITRSDPDEAARHLDHAERLLGATPSFADGVMLSVKRAQVAALREDGATAVRLARTALDTIGDELPGERGSAYFALADGLALSGDEDAADDAYGQAVAVLEHERQWREAAYACRAWARMLRRAGREEQALDVLERAAELGLRSTPAESPAAP